MKVVMIGAGYVGLTTGACLAELGHSVICVDIDAARVAELRAGRLPIYEPGLDELSRANVTAGRLSFSDDIAGSVGNAEAVFLAVGTPSGEDGDIDLSHVGSAGRQLAPALRPNAVVVIKSTVVTGTCRWLREVIAEARGGLDFSVASNPEFLREGSAIADFLEPDRIVIGTDDPRACALLEALYEPLSRTGVPVICTSTANAELIKYAANAFLALKIGFINDVADLCEATGGDVRKVALGIGLDGRIGKSFLEAGPGFGGSCFPKDTRAFVATGRKHGAPQKLVETLIGRNEHRKREIARRVLAALERTQGSVVAVLGLAFKAGTDDVREAASLTIVPMLQEACAAVRAHDPKANAEAARHLEGVAFFDDPYEAAAGADLVVVLTEWDEFRTLDLRLLRAGMRGDRVFDCRNLWAADEAAAARLRYVGIGQGSFEPAWPAAAGGARIAGRVVAAPC